MKISKIQISSTLKIVDQVLRTLACNLEQLLMIADFLKIRKEIKAIIAWLFKKVKHNKNQQKRPMLINTRSI